MGYFLQLSYVVQLPEGDPSQTMSQEEEDSESSIEDETGLNLPTVA